MSRPQVFVLAATDYGPMIVSRRDYNPVREQYGVGTSLLETGAYEAPEVVASVDILIKLHAQRGTIAAMDGGANIGCYTLAWSRVMGKWGYVVAVEPQERVFYALCGNIALNNCFNAHAHKLVLGDRDERIAIPQWDAREPHNSGGCHMDIDCDPGAQPEETRVPIKMIRIDALTLPRLDFLKLDIEGMEPKALAGARDTIARCKTVIQAEGNICGFDAITEAIGSDYAYAAMGANVLCVPKGDPILESLATKR
jgi:FkbM family methyltransferase